MVPICLYWLNCRKIGQLILRKIIKIAATRCQILRLKCTKFDFGRGAGGAYSAPRDPLAGFKGPTSTGRKGRGEGGRGWERRGGDGRGWKEDRRAFPSSKFATTPLNRIYRRRCLWFHTARTIALALYSILPCQQTQTRKVTEQDK